MFHNKWTVPAAPAKLALVWEKDLRRKLLDDRVRQHVAAIGKKLKARDLTLESSVSEVFLELVGTCFNELAENANAQMRKEYLSNKAQRPKLFAAWEVRSWFAMNLHVGMHVTTFEYTYANLRLGVAARLQAGSSGSLLDPGRYVLLEK